MLDINKGKKLTRLDFPKKMLSRQKIDNVAEGLERGFGHGLVLWSLNGVISTPIFSNKLFYRQLHFRPPEPQIFENRSNLASNCQDSHT